MRLNLVCKGRARERRMELTWGWIVLGLVIWALGSVFVFALFSMARDQDRAARHEERRLVPYSDVTITRISG